MAKDPALRFQSLTSMRDAIRAVGSNSSVPGHMSLNAVMRELTTDTLMVDGRAKSLVSSAPKAAAPSPSVSPSGSPSASGPLLLTFSHETGGEVVIEAAKEQTLLEASLAAGIP